MQVNQLIDQISRLPDSKKQEVIDFVSFLEERYSLAQPTNLSFSNWSENQFNSMSIEQAMKDQADEPDIYTDADLKERWS
jgi:hypothetical protein